MFEIEKENLVVLKPNAEGLWTVGGEGFDDNIFYRCLVDRDENDTVVNYMINGFNVNTYDFEKNFELAHTRIMRDWQQCSLLNPEGKKLTKTAFVKQLDVHCYTGYSYGECRKIRTYVGYGMWSTPETTGFELYSFDPMIRENKRDFLNSVYRMYLATIEGNMEYIDDKEICYGNAGKPISYAKPKIVVRTENTFIL